MGQFKTESLGTVLVDKHFLARVRGPAYTSVAGSEVGATWRFIDQAESRWSYCWWPGASVSFLEGFSRNWNKSKLCCVKNNGGASSSERHLGGCFVRRSSFWSSSLSVKWGSLSFLWKWKRSLCVCVCVSLGLRRKLCVCLDYFHQNFIDLDYGGKSLSWESKKINKIF